METVEEDGDDDFDDDGGGFDDDGNGENDDHIIGWSNNEAVS